MIKNFILAATSIVYVLSIANITNAEIKPKNNSMAISKQTTSLTSKQQSDIESIHKSLTQFYRGLNQLDLKLILGVSMMPSTEERKRVHRLFNQLKAADVSMNIEVRGLDLSELSDSRASIQTHMSLKITSKGQIIDDPDQEFPLKLTKTKGVWIIDKNEIIPILVKDINWKSSTKFSL
jgi:hypothetical protein